MYECVGHPSGLLGLGVMHLTGEGAQVDHALAAKYFKRASEMKQEWIGRSDAHFYAGTIEKADCRSPPSGLEIPFCNSQPLCPSG